MILNIAVYVNLVGYILYRPKKMQISFIGFIVNNNTAIILKLFHIYCKIKQVNTLSLSGAKSDNAKRETKTKIQEVK